MMRFKKTNGLESYQINFNNSNWIFMDLKPETLTYKFTTIYIYLFKKNSQKNFLNQTYLKL